MIQSWDEAKPLNLISPGNCLHLQKNQALIHDYSFPFLKAHLLTFEMCVCVCTIHLETLRILPAGSAAPHLPGKAAQHKQQRISQQLWLKLQTRQAEGVQSSKPSPGWDAALGSPQLSCIAQVQGFIPSPACKGKVNVKCEHRGWGRVISSSTRLDFKGIFQILSKDSLALGGDQKPSIWVVLPEGTQAAFRRDGASGAWEKGFAVLQEALCCETHRSILNYWLLF